MSKTDKKKCYTYFMPYVCLYQDFEKNNIVSISGTMFLYHAGYLDRCKRDKDKVGTGKAHEALARCEQRYNSQISIKSFVII